MPILNLCLRQALAIDDALPRLPHEIEQGLTTNTPARPQL